MSSPASRRSLSTADWPIDPALENSQPSQPSPPPSPPRRITRSSQATLEASQPPPESQNEKEDEIVEIVSGPGPRRHRDGSASQSRRRPRSSSLENNGADVINPPEPKRRKTAEERQRSYAQGWETRRENLWAERILPTYSTGLDTDYSDLPPDFLLDSISQHAGRYFFDRGLMKNPKRSWHRRTSIKPNKKRRMLEQGGAIARVLRESGIQPSRLSIDSTAERIEGEQETEEEREEQGEEDGEGAEEESDRVLRPRTSTGSTPAEGADREGECSGSDTDASEDAYNPDKDADPESDEENPATNSNPPMTSSARAGSKQVVIVAPAGRTQQLREEASQKSRRRGPYIRRDMRNAIQGAGLLALGVLVEEMIRAQLKQAGYAPRQRDRRASTAVESDVEPISDTEA